MAKEVSKERKKCGNLQGQDKKVKCFENEERASLEAVRDEMLAYARKAIDSTHACREKGPPD